MKKITSGLFLFILSSVCSAQNGLENIIVEKYYVSDANDSILNDALQTPGSLPVGSVTYRIYVDMLPGYKFQAAYGVPGHEFRIETSTLFYNNEDRGATSPTYTKAQAKNNTVMLDSWLTVGAACTGNFGVLKTADDGVATVVNADGVLQNTDASAGIPISVEDGMITGTPQQVTAVGITNEIAMFDAQNDGTNGPLFSTSNGSLACLGGAMGPDTSTNQVLIAQITTNGVFCFELNIQIGTPVGGGVENYVAHSPVGNEIALNSLSYCSAVGVNDLASLIPHAFEIFPNPATDFITLKINQSEEKVSNSFSIYDIAGRIVAHKELGKISGNYTERIDLSLLEAGIYFIEVTMDGTTSTQKIIRN